MGTLENFVTPALDWRCITWWNLANRLQPVGWRSGWSLRRTTVCLGLVPHFGCGELLIKLPNYRPHRIITKYIMVYHRATSFRFSKAEEHSSDYIRRFSQTSVTSISQNLRTMNWYSRQKESQQMENLIPFIIQLTTGERGPILCDINVSYYCF